MHYLCIVFVIASIAQKDLDHMEEIRSELGNITEALTDLHEKIEDENDNSGKFTPPPSPVAVLRSIIERPSPINYNSAQREKTYPRKFILGDRISYPAAVVYPNCPPPPPPFPGKATTRKTRDRCIQIL